MNIQCPFRTLYVQIQNSRFLNEVVTQSTGFHFYLRAKNLLPVQDMFLSFLGARDWYNLTRK